MMAVAQIIKAHRRTVARTLRETYGVGLTDLGDGLSWGEALLLLEDAASDTATALGAELAGWAYRASTRDLLSLSAQIGNPDIAKKLMPWVLKRPNDTGHGASAAEVAEAQAELEAGITFAS